ncbi:uncharacterized protein LOC143297327 [Babylonia areolata]|uniref:uncharacterized protein LOC143297327 n=1 Tax=Babylonia areolata TaxID=304850 RepID=UPI003FD194D0
MAASKFTEKINEKINGKKIFIVSKISCPFCKIAKDVFHKYLKDGIIEEDDFEVMEINNDPDCVDIQTYMHKISGERTVPRVFINGKCIGGGEDVAHLDRNGELARLLKA